jgi:membrane protein YdbS with pleckstrin-like domain
LSDQPETTTRTEPSDEAVASRETPSSEPPAWRAIADGQNHPIDPRSVTVQRLTGAITAAVLSLAALLGVVIVMIASSNTWLQSLLWLALWVGITAAVGLPALLWPPVRYRHISYRLDGNGIQVRKGVWWKSTVNVPHSRVQHTDVQQGPIERGYGLATLLIHTAGTQHAVIPLAGLAHEVALAIRDYLLQEGERRSKDG